MLRSLLVVSMISLLFGCALGTSNHRSSSVVTYLYPNKNSPMESVSIPRLELPMRVGVAFVPEGRQGNSTLTERDKLELQKAVATHFEALDFVSSIELIPSNYLRNEGSFSNLEQIRSMFGVDVIALLSYDQTQFTDEGLASISYWTLIGAYLIRGEKNDTHTLVDAAVYDIQSRKMLFRAPGSSHIKSKATPVNQSEQLRADSIQGFHDASADLVTNLKLQLTVFQDKLKESPDSYEVVHKPGYTGSGSTDALFILMLLMLAGGWLWRSRRTAM
ncbi:MAG: rhombotarget lipoprotein [Pseudomonas sp.]